jgi:hypothetical protein
MRSRLKNALYATIISTTALSCEEQKASNQLKIENLITIDHPNPHLEEANKKFPNFTIYYNTDVFKVHEYLLKHDNTYQKANTTNNKTSGWVPEDEFTTILTLLKKYALNNGYLFNTFEWNWIYGKVFLSLEWSYSVNIKDCPSLITLFPKYKNHSEKLYVINNQDAHMLWLVWWTIDSIAFVSKSHKNNTWTISNELLHKIVNKEKNYKQDSLISEAWWYNATNIAWNELLSNVVSIQSDFDTTIEEDATVGFTFWDSILQKVITKVTSRNYWLAYIIASDQLQSFLTTQELKAVEDIQRWLWKYFTLNTVEEIFQAIQDDPFIKDSEWIIVDSRHAYEYLIRKINNEPDEMKNTNRKIEEKKIVKNITLRIVETYQNYLNNKIIKPLLKRLTEQEKQIIKDNYLKLWKQIILEREKLKRDYK